MARKDKSRASRTFDYDVCLSFAGENRAYVRKVADALVAKGIRVFFDEYARADMWGKDLYTHLDDVYQDAARFCVLFVSKHYARKVWPNHEREAAQARALRAHTEYILPARFDNTRVPGLRPTVGYVNLRSTTPDDLAALVIRKLGTRQIAEFFPPVPDRLFDLHRARSQKARWRLEARARGFFTALRRMTKDERTVVALTFLSGCPADLPDDIHVDVDLLRRLSGFPETKLIRLLAGISSLGFYSAVREGPPDDSHLGNSRYVHLEWHDLSTDDDVSGNATDTVNDVVQLVSGDFCEEHGLRPFLRLDFSGLSSKTMESRLTSA